jgi:hypothetical protein
MDKPKTIKQEQDEAHDEMESKIDQNISELDEIIDEDNNSKPENKG